MNPLLNTGVRRTQCGSGGILCARYIPLFTDAVVVCGVIGLWRHRMGVF